MFNLFALRSDSVTMTTSTTTSTTTIPKSPTKSGEMREDKHWVLKTPRCPGFEHPYKPHALCHALTSDEVDFKMWRSAPGVAEFLDQHNGPDRWIGRRINDEVELFFEESDEEVSTDSSVA